MKRKILFLSFLIIYQAQAQLALLPESLEALPELHRPQGGSSGSELYHFHHPSKESQPLNEPVQFTESQVKQLAVRLDQQFQSYLERLEAPRPDCASPELPDYLLALQIKGDLNQCSDLAKVCGAEASTPRVDLSGALCESVRYRYEQAEFFFAKATATRWRAHPHYSEAVFQRASYSLFGHAEDQVDLILSLLPKASEAERRLWKGVLQRVGGINLAPLSKEEVDLFLEEQIEKAEPSLKSLLLTIQIRILQRAARYQRALTDLDSRSSEIKNPLLWYDLAYNTIYSGLDTNFRWSREILIVSNKYSQIWMNFPTERNTYNYSEIYEQVCTDFLIPLNEKSEFRRTQQQLRSGEIGFENALKLWTTLKPQLENKADFLTAYAGLLSLAGRHEEAFELYFRAHKLCPFYNRAHWGLVVEKRFFMHRGRPDFDRLVDKMERELLSRPVPEGISSYVLNWKSLNSESQKRVVYGARIFLPYMKTLANLEFQAYMKLGFDLLSDSPGMDYLRNERIGGPGYPHDNRLWDDVRGAGGWRVVADISEVFNTVHGDYNLLGHEMAHQFQVLLENFKSPGYQCIVNQYAEAKAQKNFPDVYSSQNKEEHFAQGVTYFLVPDDSPARFGLNRSWLVQNNQNQLQFIQSLDEAQGQLDLIKCPTSASLH